ncbi:hypothetical protein SRHO_G00313120 [Serrasalmus rhombeus]
MDKTDLPPPGPDDLPLSLLEMGCSGRFELLTHPLPSNKALHPQSTLPHGLPPTSLDLKMEVEKRFLRDPAWMPIHDTTDAFQKFLKLTKRDRQVDSLLHCSLTPLHSGLSVVRDPTTGLLLDFTEVLLEHTDLSAKNSLSLQRQPGPPAESLRGSNTNYPFLPAGMEELTLEQIKKKSELEEDIDFEHDLLAVPPGFKAGMDFSDKEAKTMKAEVNLLSLLSSFDDIIDQTPEEKEKGSESGETSKLPRTNSLEDLGIKDAPLPSPAPPEASAVDKTDEGKKKDKEKKEKKWAVPVDITFPCDDFYKRIPDPAFKSQWGVCVCSCVHAGPCSHTVQKLKAQDITAITVKTLKVIPERIIDNYNKRQQPRFRMDPPGQAISTATQELLRLAEANPDGIGTLDPVNDLHLKGVDVVEGVMRQRVLQDSLKDFHCTHSPTFTEQFARVQERMSLQEELDRLLFLVSDLSLTLLPEYNQRIKVLKELKYIDESDAVQLKGRVACQISSHELLLTELLFENTLSPLAPEESAALLSCLVFTQNTQIEPHIPNTIQEGIDRVLCVAQRIGELQRECGIAQTAEDFVSQFKFGLTEVVYCWARGMPFAEIAQLTDVQEGTVVRCIQRLDEVLKEVRQAARIVGDSVLGSKMERASLAIRRDIVFTASLYTH